jgi:cell division protein FtsI/penicillin-binding protein 2
MARFYTALATDGEEVRPSIARRPEPQRTRIFQLTDAQFAGLRRALAGVVSRGTAIGEQVQGLVIAGKTGSAQNPDEPTKTHAWFVGFAPADQPRIVVAVMLEFGGHGGHAARLASAIIAHYLKVARTSLPPTEG